MVAATDDPLLGQTLGGRYVIEALIGEGGLGRVYRARHVKISRRYAVKVPFGDVSGDDRLRLRFAREAEAASRLDHPNLVGVLDVGETEAGLLYLVMDFVDGVSLGEMIDDGPMAASVAANLVGQIAAGLIQAHERGLIHRDLKPENVLVVAGDDGPVVRIVDFGIAILGADEHSRVTTQGVVLGTPQYMAPEQASADPLDARTDLFALGVILYELLAGVIPFDGAGIEIARQHLVLTPPAIAERVPGLVVDPVLESLAFWLMAKKPADRPASAAVVVEVLRQLARAPEAPTSAPWSAAVEATPTVREVGTARLHPGSRGRRVAAIATVVVVVIALGVIAGRSRSTASDAARLARAAPDAGDAAPAIDHALDDGAAPPPSTTAAASAVDAGTDLRASSGAAIPPPGPTSARAGDHRAGEPTGPGRVAVRAPVRDDHRALTATSGRDAGVTPGAAPVEPVVDAADLRRLYAAVGERLNRAFDAADPRAASLRVRYGQLGFLQALRDPAEAIKVQGELRAIDRQLSSPAP